MRLPVVQANVMTRGRAQASCSAAASSPGDSVIATSAASVVSPPGRTRRALIGTTPAGTTR